MLSFAGKEENKRVLNMRSHSRMADSVKIKTKAFQLEQRKEIKLRGTEKHKLFRLKRTHFVYFTIFIVCITFITNV